MGTKKHYYFYCCEIRLVVAASQGAVTFIIILARPTCDSIDIVAESVEIPALEISDLIIGLQMGRTKCCLTVTV